MGIRAINMSIRDSIMPFRAFVMAFPAGKNVGNEEMWILFLLLLSDKTC
jgi:hypothetical protein